MIINRCASSNEHYACLRNFLRNGLYKSLFNQISFMRNQKFSWDNLSTIILVYKDVLSVLYYLILEWKWTLYGVCSRTYRLAASFVFLLGSMQATYCGKFVSVQNSRRVTGSACTDCTDKDDLWFSNAAIYLSNNTSI